MLRNILNSLEINEIVSMDELVESLELKERSIREAIRTLKQSGKRHGFEITTITKSGYSLNIVDHEKYEDFVNALPITLSNNRSTRILRILYYLLHYDDYQSIQKIADYIEVSRQTTILDLENLNEYLDPLDLILESKSHYGVKIVGEERDLRKAFSKYVINSKEYVSNALPYFNFINEEHYKKLREFITSVFKKHNVEMSKQSLDSLISHIKVLLFRVRLENFIDEISFAKCKIEDTYISIAREIIEWIQIHQPISIPSNEIEYLASQISGRTSIDTLPKDLESEIHSKLIKILKVMDEEFLTDFSNDELLIQSLTMHIYPLRARIAHRITLVNPLIEELSSRYANVFLVAMRFSELWNQWDNFDLNRDEVGYIALHFASNIERRKIKILNQYRNILLISEMGRGNVMLLKHKLQTIFPNSNITAISYLDQESIESMYIDLILTTLPQKITANEVQVISIPEILHDEHLNALKDTILLNASLSENNKESNVAMSLFSGDLFRIIEDEEYLDAIEFQAKQMVTLGYADPSFPSQVIQREERFSTIYSNYIAGPHSMTLSAIKECIGITIFRKAKYYQDRKVKIAFLLNIKKGNLFLYREISRFLLAIMSDIEIVKELCNLDDYDTFINCIGKIKY